MGCGASKADLAQKFKSSPEGAALFKDDPATYKKEEQAFVDAWYNNYKFENGKLSMKYTEVLKEDALIDPVSKALDASNELMHNFVAMNVLPRTIDIGQKVLPQVDAWATENIPLYTATRDMLKDNWESNEAIMYMKTYINPSRYMGDELYSTLKKLAAISTRAQQQNVDRVNERVAVMTAKLESTYSQAEIAKLDDIIAKAGIYSLSHNRYLHSLISGEKTLVDIENELKQSLKSVSPTTIQNAEDMARIYLGKERKYKNEDLTQQNFSVLRFARGTIEKDLNALTTIYALQQIDGSVDTLKDLYTQHRDIYDELIGMSANIKSLTDKIMAYTGESSKARGNLIMDITNKNHEIEPVTLEMLHEPRYANEKMGWTILRHPTDKSVGLVYREAVSDMQDGIGVNISYMKSGISLKNLNLSPSYIKEDMKATMSEAIPITYLTEEEKKTLGFENNPVKSLAKSWAHKQLIIETQAVRDTFVEQLTGKYTEGQEALINGELVDSINSNTHPVFLSFGDMNVEALVEQKLIDKKILQKYRRVDTTLLSDIAGFKKSVQYVRKDLASYVEGYRQDGVFKNNHAYNQYHQGLRHLVTWAKTNLIIVNIPKITFDLGSGISLAMAKGASIQEAIKYGKEAIELSTEMSKLVNQRLEIKTKLAFSQGDEREKDRLRGLLEAKELEIEQHAFSGASANGFVNSLSTEMLTREMSSQFGLSAAIDNVLDKIVKNADGETYSKFNEAIKSFSKAGFNIETVYGYLADKLDGTSAQGVSNILKEVADDMSRAKSKENMKDYLSQLLLTPNSHFVRLGSAATLYADLIPRWILYKASINRGMSENEAAMNTTNTFLDYAMNLPPEMKFMSDIYLLPFPSFFVRMQRVLLNLADKSPVSLLGHVMASEFSGLGQIDVLKASIFHKWSTDSVFTNTFDLLSGSNLIPFGNAFYY